MQNGHVFQLSYQPGSFDWKPISERLGAFWHVVVAMYPAPEKIGGIELSDRASLRCRPDVGVVVAAPGGGLRVKGSHIRYPEVGTDVLVHPEDGVWIDDFHGAQLRSYGHFIEGGDVQPCDWWESIMAGIDHTQTRPYGFNVLLKLDSLENKTESGLYLPDRANQRSGIATVEAVGDLVNDLQPGARVLYDAYALKQEGKGFDLGGDENLRLIHQDAILCQILSE